MLHCQVQLRNFLLTRPATRTLLTTATTIRSQNIYYNRIKLSVHSLYKFLSVGGRKPKQDSYDGSGPQILLSHLFVPHLTLGVFVLCTQRVRTV